MSKQRQPLTPEQVRQLLTEEEERFNNHTGPVLVNVSGGAASALAWHRCLQRFGKENVFPVFADTESEDEDLYRFLQDCVTLFDQPLVRLTQGMDIWDVFDKFGVARMALAGGACKASVELKIKPLDRYAEENGFNTRAVGLGFDEPDRIAAARARMKGFNVLFPLVAGPRLSSCQVRQAVENLGLKLPRLYDQGFVHNNCKGGCILSGLAQWNAYRKLNPEGFAYARNREAAFTEKTGFTILRDRRGGDTKGYPLSQLQQDAEAGRVFRNDWQSNCSCMSDVPLEALVDPPESCIS
jgi:3'-phosphoadenosine 5'-phosphosulfate sulfotransferase (PAPS reductase)/FAD synthetase